VVEVGTEAVCQTPEAAWQAREATKRGISNKRVRFRNIIRYSTFKFELSANNSRFRAKFASQAKILPVKIRQYLIPTRSV